MVAMTGCADLEQVLAARDSAQQASTRLVASADEQERAASQLPEGDPAGAHLRREAEQARVSAAALDAAIRQVDQVLAEAREPTSPISAATSALAPYLPAPAGAGLLLGGALAAMVLRAGRLKGALVSVVKGIETAKKNDDAFRARFEEHANTFRTIQTPAARRAVDEVTHDGFMLRWPI